MPCEAVYIMRRLSVAQTLPSLKCDSRVWNASCCFYLFLLDNGDVVLFRGGIVFIRKYDVPIVRFSDNNYSNVTNTYFVTNGPVLPE